MTKKIELSSTIHLLGEILGNVIKEQEGLSIFSKIEKIRSLSKSSRGKNKKIINKSFNKLKSETTFIGIKSAKILEFKKIENIYKVTVNFVSEIITCVKDKNDKILEGNPDTIKTVNDDWQFSKNMWSQDPTWYLVSTSNK